MRTAPEQLHTHCVIILAGEARLDATDEGESHAVTTPDD